MDKKRDHLNSTRRGPQAGRRHRTGNPANSWPIAKMLAVFVVAILAIGVALASPGLQGASLVHAIDGTHILTVQVDGNGTVTSDAGSIDCPNVDCDDVYAYGTDVQLTATPDPGWFFASWSGGLGGTVNPETVTMDIDKTVTATFGTICNTPVLADVVIMVDRTSTIGSVERKAQTAAAKSLVLCMDQMDPLGKPYIAIGAYGASGNVKNSLDAIISHGLINQYGSDDGAKDGDLYAAIDDIAPQASGSSTNLADAVTIAQAELDASPRDSNQKIIVLISAAFPNEPADKKDPSLIPDDAAWDAADLAKKAGTEIFTIVINANSDHPGDQVGEFLLASMATQESLNNFPEPHMPDENNDGDHFFVAGGSDVEAILLAIFGQLADVISPPYDLDITVVGNGTVTSVPTGIDCGLDCSQVYDGGVDVVLSATADTGWTFTGWSGHLTGAANPDTVLMNANKAVTATFTIDTHSLGVSVVGNGTVTGTGIDCGLDCGEDYDYGTGVALSATAATGWSFTGWSDGLTGAVNPETVTMNGDQTVTATFTIDTHSLGVSVVGNGAVTGTGIDCGIDCTEVYDYGTGVALSATPVTGWTFTGWSDGLTGAVNPDTVTMNGDQTVTATFTIDTHSLGVSVVGNGSVTSVPAGIDCGIDCGEVYDYGTGVALSASADTGWSFTGWSGALTGTINPDTVTMNGDQTVTATFTIDTHSLGVSVVGNGTVTGTGIDCGLDCGEVYDYGTGVALSASADTGWSFTGWSGALTGTINPDTVTMNGDQTVTATFTIDTHNLGVSVVGNGSVTSVPAGIDCGIDCGEDYDYGTGVALSASADTGWSFTGWSDGLTGAVNPDTVTMNGDQTVTATFTIDTHSLGVSVVGNGSVTSVPAGIDCGIDCGEVYDYGTGVALSATADTGWSFTGWSGDLTGTANPETVTMDGDRTVTATFTIDTHILTVNVTGNGSVSGVPAGNVHDYGTDVELSASAGTGTGWTFTGWSGDLTGTTNPETVTMDGDRTVTATFTIDTHILTVNVTGNGSVSGVPTGNVHDYGTDVVLTATPATGWSFTGWSGDLTGAANPETVTMDGDRTVTATFTIDTHILTVNVTGNGSVGGVPTGNVHDYGTDVALTATADTGWTFTGWSGGLTGTANPDTVTMDGDRTVTATFTIDTHTLTVNVTGNGSVGGVPTGNVHDYGTDVVLTATPATGWSFTGWSGDLTGAVNPETVTMDGNKTVTATFTIDTHTLSVNVTGNGSVGGVPTGNVHDYGTDVVLTATPATGWSFTGWSGDLTGAVNPETVTMDGDKTVTATFTIDTHTLSVNVTGNGSAGGVPTGNVHDYGTDVVLTATAATGWSFTGWSGDLTGAVNPETVTMDGDKTVTATFTIDPTPPPPPIQTVPTPESFILTLTLAGNGSGTLTGGGSYSSGTVATVAAAADAGSTFEGWTGPDAGECETGSVVMSSDKDCTGTFLLQPVVPEESFTLTLTLAGNGSGTLTGGGSYSSGTVATVAAAADTGSTFEGWTGPDAGECESGSVVMSSDKDCTGTFLVTTVNVVDNTAPVINLLGSDPMSVEVGDIYVDAGAVAVDDLEGDLSEFIVTGGLPIDTAVIGTSTVTYDVSDSSGNAAAQVTRTVNVVDNTAPIINLLGSDPVSVEVGDIYVDAGAVATDDLEGDLSEFIVTGGLPIDTSVLGVYTVTYDVSDSSGNAAAQVTRTVNVVDNTAPVINLLGSDPVSVEVGDIYVDAGAVATDDLEGDLSEFIVTGGLPIDTSVLGVYTVTYDVSDSSGNAAAQVTRTVNVVDTTVPLITLVGSDSVTLELGDSYVDAGATAVDLVDGDLTTSIVTGGLPIDTSVLGVYTVTYDVSDSSGNAAAQVTRTVNVVDTTPPVALPEPTPTPTATPLAATDDSGPAFSRLGGSLASLGIPGLTGAQIAGLIILLNMLLAALRLRQRSAERNWLD